VVGISVYVDLTAISGVLIAVIKPEKVGRQAGGVDTWNEDTATARPLQTTAGNLVLSVYHTYGNHVTADHSLGICMSLSSPRSSPSPSFALTIPKFATSPPGVHAMCGA
jgi:hypothetical protein